MKHLYYCLFLIVALLATIQPASSQISTNEEPVSFSHGEIQQIGINVPVIKMPKIDLEKLQKEDEEEARNGLPPRFGYPHKVDLSLNNSGKWRTLSNGDRLWQLTILCPDALSINLLYDEF